MKFIGILYAMPLLVLLGCAKNEAVQPSAPPMPPSSTASSILEAYPTTKPCKDNFADGYHVSDIRKIAQKLSAIHLLKDDFETTESYQQRLKSDMRRQGLSPDNTYLFSVRIDPKFVRYNADTQELTVEGDAVSKNAFTDIFRVLGEGSKLMSAGIYIPHGGAGENLELPLSISEQTLRTYTGHNAFGVAEKVRVVHRTQYGIFEREAWNDSSLFGRYVPAFELTMPPEQARKVKASGQVIFSVILKHPYYAEGIDYDEATLEHPTELTQFLKYLIGDIQCAALVTDGKVLAVTSTQ